jgi:hypothetical protein
MPAVVGTAQAGMTIISAMKAITPATAPLANARRKYLREIFICHL